MKGIEMHDHFVNISSVYINLDVLGLAFSG